MADNTSVRVAIRVRPLVPNEISRGCQEILEVVDKNEQILVKCLDKDRAYSFNYVLSNKSNQDEIYSRCVKPLIGNLFKGYNVTILAYGQTGSGKTHTMGTTYSGEGDMGVIPRAVHDIFSFVKDNFSFDFIVTVSFMELYQEVLYDLLSQKAREQCVLEIREDPLKGIHIPNLTEVEVTSVKEVLDALEKGTAGRATSATAMNAQSSRSHAIFSVNISMNHKENSAENKQAKLNLVDLAGSERSKKTQATGNTFKEGVNINKGLLALGNVISYLGDERGQHGFIPYRDSNLTRLLKDSLGGNSITLMIACVSPADYNLEETISTLRYADRARKIKNKPIINQDPKAAEINALKKTITQLRLQILGQGGPVVTPAELESLKKEVADLKMGKRDLNMQLSATLISNTGLHEKIIIMQSSNEELNTKLTEVIDIYNQTLNNITVVVDTHNFEPLKEHLKNLQEIQNKFVEIIGDQKILEEKISFHNENKHIPINAEENEKDDSLNLEEQQESHANRQFKLNVQLTEIEQELLLKENLAKQLMTNCQYFIDPQATAEIEAKISQLEKEKEELLQKLKNVGNSEKISEQRRKRVQELEQQQMELKKQLQEKNQLSKQKAKAEQRIEMLKHEIIQMKQIKVKLVRTMREESDKFRQWKLVKERECIRLKREDIKKEHEINKMKVMHNKQQNVFKRRVEEAEAINKRLKVALALKKQTQDARNSGKTEKFEPWLKQEYDLFVNVVEADASLKVLLEDRATLQSQLDDLRKHSDNDGNSAEYKSIEEDLELRSVQIQDLQQKLLDSDEESRTKIRFEKFQTMAEAKYGLKFLFARVAQVVKEKVSVQMKFSELQEMHKEVLEKLAEAKKINEQEVTSLQEKYENKISLLLEQMKDSHQMKEEELLAKINELQIEKTELEKKLENVMIISSNAAKTPQIFKETFEVPQEVSPLPVSSTITPLKANTTFKIEQVTSNDSIINTNDSILFDDDDVENDPDWRKTPLGKRIMEEKKKINRTTLFLEDKPSKRSSEGGCTCKTNCKGSRCGCKKMGNICGTSCKCKDTCENREEHQSNGPRDSGDEFKKPSDVDDAVPKKRYKKTRNLFNLN